MKEEIINELEKIIESHMIDHRDDYIDGIIDGLLLAIKVIEER